MHRTLVLKREINIWILALGRVILYKVCHFLITSRFFSIDSSELEILERTRQVRERFVRFILHTRSASHKFRTCFVPAANPSPLSRVKEIIAGLPLFTRNVAGDNVERPKTNPGAPTLLPSFIPLSPSQVFLLAAHKVLTHYYYTP